MRSIIITGATSGIGKELAIQYAAKGDKVGLIGRRTERLEELKEEIGELAYIKTLDVTDHEQAEVVYQELIDEMGGMDMMILNAGVGRIQMLPPWRAESKLIEVNALAFAHGCHFAFDYFKQRGGADRWYVINGIVIGSSPGNCIYCYQALYFELYGRLSPESQTCGC